jgi:phospholipid/cholesterol/gamma-HCH transport system substrate-binding protein
MIVRTPSDRMPPYKTAGLVVFLVAALALSLLRVQFRGDFLPRTQLTMMSARAGLSMDPGATVTYNSVEIGQMQQVPA